MATWYVKRREGAIVFAGRDIQPGEAEEEMDSGNAELIAFFGHKPVPSQVTAAQMIRALDKSGDLVAVDAAAMAAGGLVAMLWQRAGNFVRTDPLVIGLAQSQGKDDAWLDAIFTDAAKY